MKRASIYIAMFVMCAMLCGFTAAQDQKHETAGNKESRKEPDASILQQETLVARTLPIRPFGFSLIATGNRNNSVATSKNAKVSDGTFALSTAGTGGHLVKFLTDAGDIGNSIMVETKSGNIGIGTATPQSKLSVQGMIETTLGGYKFPDGSTQTTAFTKVEHDNTLTGDGTASSVLGIKVPLTLGGALTVNGLIKAVSPSGNAVDATGGDGFGDGTTIARDGASGVVTRGGNTAIRFGSGGTGIDATGGNTNGDGNGGTGVNALGGDTQSGLGGFGIISNGGNSKSGPGGVGLAVAGGATDTGFGGNGITVSGGISTQNKGGDGVEIFGGGGLDGGVGLDVTGGSGSGSNRRAGDGIVVRPGTPFNGAEPGFAGQFFGDVLVDGTLTVRRDLNVEGNLTKGGGSFKIDHPLDPANKYLYHSFVESPDMMNIYNGNVTTDKNGDAIVVLPEYFGALNRDFRYQLTVIGTFAQAIVGEKIKDNHFRIKTNSPNVEVSWQVTGIRQDAYANKNRIPVEEVKPERERGFYLYPGAFNQPEEKSVHPARAASAPNE